MTFFNKSADMINLRLVFEPQNVPDGNECWHFKFLKVGNFVHLIFTEICLRAVFHMKCYSLTNACQT